MDVPPPLGAVLQAAHESIERHPRHILPPFERRAIYREIERAPERAGAVRGRLGIATARRVLPIWHEAFPEDGEPRALVDAAEEVLQGARPAESLDGPAQRLFERIAELYAPVVDADPPTRIRVWRAQVAGNAAVQAAFDVTGAYREGFDAVNIDPTTTDVQIDPWSSDSAKFAAYALAGGDWEPQADWEPEQDPAARRAFWNWWLDAAIPSAWEIAHSGDMPANKGDCIEGH